MSTLFPSRPKPLSALVALTVLSSTSAWADAQCNIADLAASHTPVQAIMSADRSCFTSWYDTTSIRYNSVYQEDFVSKVAQRLSQTVANYQGEAAQARQIANLAEYVRAAYYVRFYADTTNADFSDTLDDRLAGAIQAFLRSPYATAKGDAQTDALHGLTLMADSIKRLPKTLDLQIQLLENLKQDRLSERRYADALNNLFRAMAGHQSRQVFYDVLAADLSLIDRLYQFVVDNPALSDSDHGALLVSNTVREMGRLLIAPQASVRERVISHYRDLLPRFPLGGKNDAVWVGMVEMVDAYAPDKMAELGLSDAKATLEAKVVPYRHQCDGPAIIRSQSMTQAQSQQACESLHQKEVAFHQTVNSGYQAVTDDLNDSVEVVVFDNPTDYKTYSSFLFGNSTDNGGQYLEGNPAEPDNQARFIAYRNDNGQSLSIWNLEHEYVHYLDGRFNMYGDFNDVLRHGHTVWWLEGFAEYMAHGDDYAEAIRLGKEGGYSLSDVFATTYQHDVNRVYRWGYLAVRFLFEQHPEAVDTLLAAGRTGKFEQWANLVKDYGHRYDNAFAQWLTTLEDTDNGEPPRPDPEPDQPEVTTLSLGQTVTISGQAYSEHLYQIDIAQPANALTFSIEGQGNADLYVAKGRQAHYYDFDATEWNPTSHETVTLNDVEPGRYTLSVTGRGDFTDVTVAVNAEGQVQPEPTPEPQPETPAGTDDLRPTQLNVASPNSISVYQRRYLYADVPKGATKAQVWVMADGDAGDVSVFAAEDYWPTQAQNHAASEVPGSNQYIEVDLSDQQRLHLLLAGDGSRSQTDVRVYFR
ncbi:M9 family metallopeptidase [Salinivibrio sp. ES.052]|uniref:M9 family metallopeptidase n=1 Tax=Salinivibrio sp. ES.052 TaxID=1882823 RepID=UPI00092C9C6F|nr:M9 family metallopeptidase [Salinivibrio sp. ES.052]SIN90211.1 microbial collagenase [Salinivibrio sp. ES.052]